MDRKAETITLLLRVGWFARLPEPLKPPLLAIARVRRVAADEALFSLGEPLGGFFGLETGCLAIEAAEADSAPQKALLVHPGAWIGEGPVAGLPSRLVGAWATRPSLVLAIESAAFRRVAVQAPDLWRQLVLLALENHARTMGLAQDLMLRGSRERLAALLARLAGLRDAWPPEPAMVDATQSELAAIANLSRSVVAALLPEMERDGVIKLRRASVEIVDAARLLRIAAARTAAQ